MEKMTFETAIKRLEEITLLIEKGELTLDESIKLYEEGVKLVNLCNNKISNVEKSIKILLNSDGELVEEDFVSNDK